MSIYGTIPSDLMKGLCDSAVLGMDVTDDKLREYIEMFKEYSEASAIVVNYHQLELAMELCEGTNIEPCPAIAYPPFCGLPTELKVSQAKYAVEKYNVPYVLFIIDHTKFAEGKYEELKNDMAAVVKAVDKRAIVMAMPDFAFWSEEECVELAKIVKDAGIDIIKSSGGLGRVESPKKIARVVKELENKIKVMGTSGITNLEELLDMVDANPDKLAISRSAFFDVYEEVHSLEKVRLTKEELANKIEGLVWHPTIKEIEVIEYLKKAKEIGLYGVSVDPRWVPLASKVLDGSNTKVITRINYPLGELITDLKVEEIEWVINNGSEDIEIQTVLNVSAFKSGKEEDVKNELKKIIEAAKGHFISLILQVSLLTSEEISGICEICKENKVCCIEPRHGFFRFSSDGSIINADKVNYLEIRKLKELVGDEVLVKATGAMKTVASCLVPLANGAVRVTTPDALNVIENYDVLVGKLNKYNK